MPRNGSGTATRVTPPGASGYIAGNDILPSEVNGEVNDIYTELTNSIDKAGRTTPTANLPMGGFLHSGLGQATANGQTVRYQALTKGADINITASGSQSIPSEGSTFVVTAASAFNITGFTNRYDGRTATLVLPANITLVNSASLLLKNGVTRVSVAGEAITVFQQSTGVWKEVGDQNLIDLSSYSGADINLGIGQSAIYSISAITSLPLRIATATQQSYEISICPTFITGVVTAGSTTISMNNATLGTNWPAWFQQTNITAATVSGGVIAGGVLTLTGGGSTPRQITARIVTNTNGKSFQSNYGSSSNAANFIGYIQSACQDTTTVWTSLGTLTFISAASGDVVVRRLY